MKRLAFLLALLPSVALAQQPPADPPSQPPLSPEVSARITALGQEVMQLENEKVTLMTTVNYLQEQVTVLKKAAAPQPPTPEQKH